MKILYTVVSVWHSYTLSYVVDIILRDIYDSVYTVQHIHICKKNKVRREGSGRHCCLGRGGHAESIHFFAALYCTVAILHQDDLKNWMICTRTL